MKTLKKQIPWLIGIILSLCVFSACEDEDNPFYSPLVGTWQSYNSYQPTAFTFYDNGTGVYQAYDDWGRWASWRFEWCTIGNQQLTIYFDAWSDPWVYNYWFEAGQLVLDDGYNRPIWYTRTY